MYKSKYSLLTASNPVENTAEKNIMSADCRAMAIGARSQAARTYLEKFLTELPDCDLETLVKHGLRALRDTLPNEVDLTNKNVSIAVVGEDTPFTIHDDAAVDPYLAGIEGEERRGQR